MQKSYILREAARQDIKEIGRYTHKRYGKEKRNTYLKTMSERFESLSEMPYRGRARPDVKDGYFSNDYEKHIIFYLIHDAYIEIVGIIHQSMEPSRHL